MKIKHKIFLMFFISSISLVGVVIGVFYYLSSTDLRNSVNDYLETTAQLRGTQIEAYLEKITSRAVDFSSDGLIKTSLFDASNNKDIREIQGILNKHLIDNKLIVSKGILGIYVLDTNNKIIGTTNSELDEPDKLLVDIFLTQSHKDLIDKQHTHGIFYDEAHDSPVLMVSAPIYTDDNTIGVIINKIKTDELYQILTDRTTLDATWESYIVNSDKIMISPSRFWDDVVLNRKVETKNADACFNETASGNTTDSSVLGVFTDYRDINVVGSHRFIDSMGWCLLVEIDEDDATLRIIKLFYINFLSIGASALVVSIVLSILIGRIIGKPIEELSLGAEIIEKGNFNYKVGLEGKDEISNLSRSFDKMVSTVKDYRSNMESKVNKQTENITIQKDKLEKQQMAILNVLKDIADEKDKASLEQEKISAILHNIGEGVFVVDSNRTIIVFNSQAEIISGFKTSEVIGEKYDTVIKFVDEKDSKKIVSGFIEDVMNTGEDQEMPPDTILMQKDGKKVSVAGSASPLKDANGNVIGCIVVFRDTTAEREIDKAKSEFISVASHQLRTPMTGIQWVIERFLKKETKLSKKGKEYLSDLHKSSVRLSALVDSLLNVSRIESSGGIAVDLEKVELVSLIKDYVKELTPLLVMKNITLNFKDHPDKFEITSDSKVIQNIIQSIVSNAIEYTPTGGNIDIIVEKNNEVIIRVKDTGIGIPKEAQLKIFDKFNRAENAKIVKTDGSGLGLYIAKMATEALGGKIGFKSDGEGKGTEFYIELPLESKEKQGGKVLL